MTFHDPDPTVRCAHRLWDDIDGVMCTREAAHKGGHVFLSGDGSAVPDHHREP